MRLRSVRSAATVMSLVLGGCTSFANVRSADPYIGSSVGMQFSWSAPPGDDASWFWSFDCANRCNHAMIAADLGVTRGWRIDGSHAVALGAGINGVNPYVDGYVKLVGGPRPFGVGGRLGLPAFGWQEDQLYARYDIPVTRDMRVLLNPGLFFHGGASPNGANTGSFLGYVQGLGLQFDGEYGTWTPALSVVSGRAHHAGYGSDYGPTRSVFMTASVGLTVHGRRAKPEH
jgi:hypothetical protein